MIDYAVSAGLGSALFDRVIVGTAFRKVWDSLPALRDVRARSKWQA